MNKNIIWIIVVILLVAVGIYALTSRTEEKDIAPAIGEDQNMVFSEVSEAVRAQAAQDLEATGDAVLDIISIEANEWPDACLGLAVEGEMCAQVMTPGYRVTVQFEDMVKTYRTNEDGTVIREE
jgi:hypothetical protein